MVQVNVATIGFTKSNAEHFFERSLKAGVKKLIDVRLHNTSQLAGFAKADDLAYFLRKIGGIEYVHQPHPCAGGQHPEGLQERKGRLGRLSGSFPPAHGGAEDRAAPGTADAGERLPALLGGHAQPLPPAAGVQVPAILFR